MNKQTHDNSFLPSPATCEDCVHSIRDNRQQDEIVCVAHLKTMPTNNTWLCDLYLTKYKTGGLKTA